MNWDDLSDKLKPICELEIAQGNRIQAVERNVWTECPLAVVFKNPLHHAAIEKLGLTGVQFWENKDTHYPIQTGYLCTATRHSVAGPTR